MTVPVPLTDLLAKADDQADDLGIVIVYPEQLRALCEALRIAVEGLDELTARFDGDEALVGSPLLNARTALAAVRELVDLGGDK